MSLRLWTAGRPAVHFSFVPSCKESFHGQHPTALRGQAEREKHFSAACAEYQKRLGAFCKLTVTELPEVRLPEHPTPTQVEGRWPGGRPFWPSSPKSAKVIALCVEGVQLSSPALAAQMEQWMVEGASHLTLIIGGSFGLHPSVKEAAHLRLSMSPHDLSPSSGPGHGAGAGLPGLQIAAGTRYHK